MLSIKLGSNNLFVNQFNYNENADVWGRFWIFSNPT